MSQLRGPLCVGFVNYDRNFNLRRRDQLNVDPGFAKTIEKSRRHAGMGTHSNSDHAQLGYAVLRDETGCFHFFHYRLEQFFGGIEIVLVNCERKVAHSTLGNALHDHVDDNVCGRNRGENPPGHAGFIAHIVHRDLGLIAIDTYTANNDVFHVRGFFFRDCASVGFEA